MRGLILIALFTIVGCPPPPPPPPKDNEPPQITDFQVNPQQFRFVGGDVTVSSVVRDDRSGVDRVWAVVQRPDNTTMEVPLSLVGGDRYEGKFKVESNTRDDGQPLTYRVWLRARDRNGNETPQPGVPAEGLTVEVTAPLNPPPKPSL
jgi:hypothetical protein